MQAFGVSAVLMLFCTLLQANALPVTKNNVNEIQVLLELQHALKKLDTWTCDEVLYTPANVKEQCFRTALSCFSNELNGTRFPCGEDHENMNFTLTDFHKWVSHLESFLPSTDPSCLPCECSEKKDFQTYRKEFKTFSEHLMTWFNPRPKQSH